MADEPILAREKAKESAQLSAISDYVQEAEIDAKQATAALNSISAADQESKQKAQQAETAKLLKIHLPHVQVDYLAKEFDITHEQAEERLRATGQATGTVDLKAAMLKLVNSQFK